MGFIYLRYKNKTLKIFSRKAFFCTLFILSTFSYGLLAQENNSILCSDGLDNDGDGNFDCDDSECQALANMGCVTCLFDGLSFADYVIEYDGACETTNQFTSPEEALGVADNELNSSASANFVSLGEGGSIKLGFSDNLVINSGTDEPDIWIFEVGITAEVTFIELRPADDTTNQALNQAGILDSDGDGFYELGSSMGATSSIDIDNLLPGYVKGVLKFNAIEIQDRVDAQCEDEPEIPGADIDAVCALSSVSSEECGNGIDDDLDGFIDCDDPQLAGDCCCLVTKSIELGNDVYTCFGDTIFLQVDDIFNSYNWSTGINSNAIIVTQSGNYSLTVVEENDCELIDSVEISITEDPVVNRIVGKCIGQEIVVDGRSFSIPGVYVDTISYPNQICDTIFRYEIFDFDIVPDFLGPDQVICARSITIQSPWTETSWPDGTVQPTYILSQSDILFVTAIDENNCLVTDSVQITLANLGNFFVPSAFSPNDDAINDHFQLFFENDNIQEYTLSIFDRFGNQVFKQTGVDIRWDGNVNGRAAQTGTYVYQIEYSNGNCEQSEIFSGDVILLR